MVDAVVIVPVQYTGSRYTVGTVEDRGTSQTTPQNAMLMNSETAP